MADIGVGNPTGPTLRISAQQRDFLIFTIWSMVTFVQFRGDDLLLYPLALYYAYTILRDQRAVLPLIARSWVLLLFPAWSLLSPLWAELPVVAFKNALYLSLTIIICLQVAANLAPRQIMHAICLAASVIGVVNIVAAFGLGQGDLGIFTSKNAMGKNMVVLWIVAFATFLDPGTHWPVRLAALGMAGIAAFMAAISDSATAVLLVLASSLMLVAGAIVLRGGLLRASRLAALFVTSGLVLGAAFTYLPYQQIDPVDAVLNQFGKDSTLTGRTVLWQYAEDQIRERPLLGVGAGGFWRYSESPLIQRIYFEFYKGPWDIFNFHNSYYEIAVHQGLIGLGLVVPAMLWGIWMIGRWALSEGSMPSLFFMSHMMVVLVRTMTEADFLKPFVLFHMVFWIGAIAAARQRRDLSDNKST